MIDRRTFMRAAMAAGATGLAGFPAALRGQSTRPKLVLGAPLTHSDWMLKDGIAWGEAGVRHMLDACKASGWSRIYCRVLDGGRAMYPSKVVRPGDRWDQDSFWSPRTDEDRKLAEKISPGVTAERKRALLAKFEAMDYSAFDALKAAVEYGHAIGLQIHAWVSINEDDHGWGLASDFAKQHPQFRWVKRDGRVYRSQMSFAFPEVRAYKLAILRELLDGYAIDGIFLDWIRTGDVRDNPQTDADGVADSGYERPNVEAFKNRYGVDPHTVANGDSRWVAVRAEAQTVFMRDVKALVGGRKPMSVLVAHPWHYRGFGDKIAGNRQGLLLDVATWANEGLIDAAVAAGYYRDGGNAEMAYQALRKETGGKIDVWTYGWVPQTVADVERDVALAAKVGADQLLLWEADYIDDRPNRAELQSTMRKYAVGG